MSLQLPRLLTTKEVAEMLGVRPGTINIWRFTKRVVIPYVKVGNSVRYRIDDINSFLESRSVKQ